MAGRVDTQTVAEALAPLCLEPGELSELCTSMTCRQPSAARLNVLGRQVPRQRLDFLDHPVPWYSPTAYFVRSGGAPGRRILFGAGAYYVQDAGSLLPVALLDPRPAETVCDLCAAPGGKATAMLERLGGAGFLLANEAIAGRVSALRLNLARHGACGYSVSNCDPGELAAELPEAFDAVLVDAPCSGQSLVARRKKDERAFSRRTITHCAARQRRILAAAAALVRPGGRLVYSTCTFAHAENEGVIDAFLAEHQAEWLAGPAEDEPPELAPYRATTSSPQGCYRLWPHRHHCEGAFAARLTKTGTDTSGGASGGQVHKSGRGRRPTGRRPGIDFSDWGRWRREPRVAVCGDRAFEHPEGAPAWASHLGCGPELAFRKGRTWFPSYALAMRRDGAFLPRRSLELSASEAADFLAGRPVAGPDDGWLVVKHDGYALGWAKGVGGTLKNHLPASATLKVVLDA